jgi:hypothetical protein
LKSISVLIPLQKVSASISQLDFSLDGITTIVAEAKFCSANVMSINCRKHPKTNRNFAKISG